MSDVSVPIVLFISVAFVVGLAMWLRHRSRREVHETLRAAIDKGQEITPSLLEHLGEGFGRQRQDIRRGVVSVALALGFVSFGLILGEPDAVRPMLGIAAFPFLIGSAYLFLARLDTR